MTGNRKKADELSKAFGLKVVQSRYSDWGNFYGLVKSYPCVLWDRSGYIIFNNEDELKIPGVSVSKRINVPKGISSLNGYKRVIHDAQLPEELPDGVEYHEGAIQQIKVNKYERDKKAREACLSITRQLHRPSDNYIAHARLLKSEITVPFANRIRSRG